MSVVKSKRKQSQFEVFHHLMKMRQRITDLLLRDFGYSFEKFNKKLEKRYGGKPYEELTDTQKMEYISTFKNICDASRKTGCRRNSINDTCTHRLRTSGGYI